jgi:8-oxo-dGTP pyrophosphatase MutT (NUDIX family)
MQVVAGLALRDGKMFLQKRKPDKLRPDLWEHPGELLVNAVVREWKEELGHYERKGDGTSLVSLNIAGFLGNRIKTVEIEVEWLIELTLFHVDLPAHIDPVVFDAAEGGWFHPMDAVQRLPMSPGSYLLYPAIRDFIARRSAS